LATKPNHPRRKIKDNQPEERAARPTRVVYKPITGKSTAVPQCGINGDIDRLPAAGSGR
jgi:hypothetical protein